MKRTNILYRASTLKQVDRQKEDIPMQRIACHEFVEEKGWVITNEFYEKVSYSQFLLTKKKVLQYEKTCAKI